MQAPREDITEKITLDPGSHGLPNETGVAGLPTGIVAVDDRQARTGEGQPLARDERVHALHVGNG